MKSRYRHRDWTRTANKRPVTYVLGLTTIAGVLGNMQGKTCCIFAGGFDFPSDETGSKYIMSVAGQSNREHAF